MFDHDPQFRRQLGRERQEGLARDYRLAQPYDAGATEDRSPPSATVTRRLRLHLRRRHAPAYLR